MCGLIIILTFVLLVTSACQNQYEAKIKIIHVYFPDFIPDDGYKEEINNYIVKKGDEIKTSDGLLIKIKDLSETKMDFTTNDILSVTEDGRIDLDAGKTEFSINNVQELEFSTTTKSSGHSYTFILEGIKPIKNCLRCKISDKYY